MTGAPAVIVIARHGARLDAADKNWHLTSPAPYDPPLTYGGWTQSRALGTRIASLLHAREEAAADNESAIGAMNGLEGFHLEQVVGLGTSKEAQKPQKLKRKKHKVIVHTSPFLRCIQTSVAISAGIAQFQPEKKAQRTRSKSPRVSRNGRLRSTSPMSRSIDSNPLSEDPMPDPEEEPMRNVLRKTLSKKGFEKSMLRIDAFLGEWLSPDYYELITPPPASNMMVAGAKAELLRRGDFVDFSSPATASGTGHFPGGWSRANGAHSNRPGTPEGGLAKMGALSHALPHRDRASSYGSVSSVSSSRSQKGHISLTTLKADPSHYTPPTPTYAISPSEPIPRGYVAHARDSCVDIDFQWDSMRSPQNWGDGGEYGEEWSSMHKRFRKGLNALVGWYNVHGGASTGDDLAAVAAEDNDEEDTELVVVIVTHGAGCNALIGGLTNQPALLDVGMASLTMAVRKESEEDSESPGRTPSPSWATRRTPFASTLADEYEMSIVASSEHLRPGVDPAKLSVLPSPQKLFGENADQRRRFGSGATSPIDAQQYPFGERGRGISSMLGSIRRSSTVNTPSPSYSSPVRTPSISSTGLWSKSTTLDSSGLSSSPSSDFIANMRDAASPPKASSPTEEKKDEHTPLPQNLGRAISQHGLWGAAPSGARTERGGGPKRRWTVNEQDA